MTLLEKADAITDPIPEKVSTLYKTVSILRVLAMRVDVPALLISKWNSLKSSSK
jgi:hypothetical protein